MSDAPQLPELPPGDPSLSPVPPADPSAPLELAYETPRPTGNAALLLQLAAIFNFVSAALDLGNIVMRIGGLIAVLVFMRHVVPPPAPGAPPPPAVSFTFQQILTAAIPAILSLAAGVLKSLAAYWFLRKHRLSWVIGLTAGIVGCVEIWSCPCCVLNLAAGVYTIVILSLQNVRDHLRAWSA